MPKLKAAIANIEIDSGDDAAALSNMLGSALAGFMGRTSEPEAIVAVQEPPRIVQKPEVAVPSPARPKTSRRTKNASTAPRNSPNSDKVEEFLRSHNGPASAREISEGSGVTYGSIFAATKDSRFRKVGRGVYELANGQSSAAAPRPRGRPPRQPVANFEGSLPDRIANLLKIRPKLDATTIAKELNTGRQAAVDAMNEDESRFEYDAMGLWSLV